MVASGGIPSGAMANRGPPTPRANKLRDSSPTLPSRTRPLAMVRKASRKLPMHFLQAGHLPREGKAPDTAGRKNLASPFAVAAILLLILTGARLSEILTLRWSYVDVDRRMLFLPDSKTGQKSITLNDASIEV